MPKLTIDQREVEVPAGATILDAARKLGIDIPTLCHRQGCEPSTSCLVCLVRVGQGERLLPACATPAVDGMQVESETPAVHQARRMALELLLSDHLGDCVAPCTFGCPTGMDIPQMLRQIAAGDMAAAIATIKRDIALPAVLGRICPAPCEKVCRRGDLDAPVAICLLKRLAADVDLAAPKPYDPLCRPTSGKRVAIIGAGPTGLAAAYYLQQLGHACTLFDRNAQLGGRLRGETSEADLPAAVLDAEIAAILRLGATAKPNSHVALTDLPQLQQQFDAVLLACGATAREQAVEAKLPVSQRGLQVEPQSYAVAATASTAWTGVFTAGNAVRGKGLVVRSVADGKEAAQAIDQFLSGQPVVGIPRPFSTKIGRMSPEELAQFVRGAPTTPRHEPAGGRTAGFTAVKGAEQAARCLHCDCRGQHTCRLRKYAAQYHAEPRRYAAKRRVFQISDTAHSATCSCTAPAGGESRAESTAAAKQVSRCVSPHGEVVFEPGKCIDCGLCVQITAAAGERLGLTFVGRGFDVRVTAPFEHSVAEALSRTAAECVAACPTAALAFKTAR